MQQRLPILHRTLLVLLNTLKTRKEIATDKIGLMGHSEGGMTAPMVASKSKDVSFLVLLAGPGIELKKLLLMQQELIPKADGVSESDIKKYILPIHEEAISIGIRHRTTAYVERRT